MFDMEQVLYGKYRLKDLCITNTGIDNTPTEEQHVNNLRWLAIVLTELEASIGPFTILSAYRTRSVNNAVTGNSDPSRKTSFHEVGMAVDFYPLTQTKEVYFGRLITTEWKEKLGEIILKPKQGSIHIGLPTASYKGAIKILDPATNSYRYMTAEEIEDHSAPYRASVMPDSMSELEFFMSYPDSSGGLFTSLYQAPFGIYSAPTVAEELEAAFEDSGVEGDVAESSGGFVKKLGLLGGFIAGVYGLYYFFGGNRE